MTGNGQKDNSGIKKIDINIFGVHSRETTLTPSKKGKMKNVKLQ